MKFYQCEHCGNIITYVKSSGVPVVCCGEKMKEIIPGVVDASKEKHVPAVKFEGSEVVVNVGTVDHPMVPEHYIEWVSLLTAKGTQLKKLNPGEKPEARFTLTADDEVLEVYAYCNLHSLWKA